jgi:hypothetical protein
MVCHRSSFEANGALSKRAQASVSKGFFSTKTKVEVEKAAVRKSVVQQLTVLSKVSE